MAHSQNWDETEPNDNTVCVDIDDAIVAVRTDTRERLATDHLFASSDDASAKYGCHKKVTFEAQIASPTLPTGTVACLYLKSGDNDPEMRLKVGSTDHMITPPTGCIQMYAGTSAPDGWLMCNGAAVSQATYADLYALIGHTFGSDPGGGNFIVPDFRGRSPLGVGTGTGLTARTLGEYDGEEDHQLTEAELAAHSHSLASDGFVTTGSGTTGNAGSNMGSAASTADTGSDTAHNTMHPYLGINFIIKT